MKKLMELLFTLISVFAFTLTGCSNHDTFTKKLYLIGEAEKVLIQVTDRELEICTSEDDQIYIDYFDCEKEYLDITISEDKVLTVKLVSDKDWTDFVGTKSAAEYRKIKIRIPDNLVAVLSANTTNENIKINSLLFTEHISLDTNGGNIICERVNVGKSINLKAKNGNITGSIIGDWDEFSISCKIKKGDCNLPTLKEGGEKSFSADCNNGNINIEFLK